MFKDTSSLIIFTHSWKSLALKFSSIKHDLEFRLAWEKISPLGHIIFFYGHLWFSLNFLSHACIHLMSRPSTIYLIILMLWYYECVFIKAQFLSLQFITLGTWKINENLFCYCNNISILFNTIFNYLWSLFFFQFSTIIGISSIIVVSTICSKPCFSSMTLVGTIGVSQGSSRRILCFLGSWMDIEGWVA